MSIIHIVLFKVKSSLSDAEKKEVSIPFRVVHFTPFLELIFGLAVL
jgi:hypothetical protein